MYDKKRFFFLPIIRDNKNSLYITDDNNYIIARDEINSPYWIWTIDNISKDKVKEIMDIIKNNKTEITTINCRKNLYDEIKKIEKISNVLKINYLECNKLNAIKISNGFMDKPKYSDKTLLAHFWQDYSKELIKPDNISLIDSLNEIDNWLEDNNSYVWREKNGKIVCMANYWEYNGIAKISYVYTPKDQRKKGYCQSLIHELTKLLLERNIEPMLYTDSSNIFAIEAYKKIGYELKETLFRFDITYAS